MKLHKNCTKIPILKLTWIFCLNTKIIAIASQIIFSALSCPLPLILNGFNACPEGVGPSSVCRFSCSFGYEVNGSVISTCSPALRWEPDVPSCIGKCHNILFTMSNGFEVLILFKFTNLTQRKKLL